MKIDNYQKVTNLLLNFKFQPNMVGFDYLRRAVLYCYESNQNAANITTKLYPMLAKEFNTRAASIERGMRMSIDNAYVSGGLLTLNDYYGSIVYTNKFKFSNSEIISILVEIIKLDNLKRKIADNTKQKLA